MLFFAFIGLVLIVFAFYSIPKGNTTLSSSGEKGGFQSWWAHAAQSGAGNSWHHFSSGSGSFGGYKGEGGSHFSGFGGGGFGGGGASGSW